MLKTVTQQGTRGNEAPRSKLRGITELKHSELPEIFLWLPLPLHRSVRFDMTFPVLVPISER